ncbi:MAG: protein kinase family protein [Spirochaetaceae bacterium]|jgi:serine/threonine-protein kinase|nr:protein kinase family protein [Spirochaetaceae bacterium]
MQILEKGEIIKFVRQRDYVFEQYLDEGGLGKTVLLLDPVMNEYFVCKKYEPYSYADKAKYYEDFKNEIRIMHKLFHKNIVRVFNYHLFPESTTGYILMDYIDGTDIETYISENPEDINNIFNQAIEGFLYLESNNILHRDIRPKNLMITNDKVLKIIDFGFGKRIMNNRVVRKPQVSEQLPLKNAKRHAFCKDLSDNQPGWRTSLMTISRNQ